MRYGRDYGGYHGGYGHDFDRGYDRGYRSVGEGRQWMGPSDRPRFRPRPRYASDYDRGYRGMHRQGGWGSAYPEPFATGLPGATPYQRYGMSDAHLWTTPWHHPVPGTGVGYSLPYGMGHGRWL